MTDQPNLNRREFLGAATAVAAGATLVALSVDAKPASADTATVSPSTPTPQYVFAIDLNKCDGCQACTIACQAEHQIPPDWGGQLGYDGKQAWIEVFDMGDGTFLPVMCQNCSDAPCAKVCPVGATYYDENHIVLIDQNRCIGCRYCVVSCMYARRFFNWLDPPVPPEDKNVPYSPDYNIPHRLGVAEKCIWCAHRVLVDDVPACVEACETAGMAALWFGDSNQDVVSNGKESQPLSVMLEGRGAYHLNDEYGTEPNAYYLPPTTKVE